MTNYTKVQKAAILCARIYNVPIDKFPSLCSEKAINTIKCVSPSSPHVFIYVDSGTSRNNSNNNKNYSKNRNTRDVFVVFRGTSTKKSRAGHNLMVNLNSNLTNIKRINSVGKVHRGFYSEYEKVAAKNQGDGLGLQKKFNIQNLILNKLNEVVKEHDPNTKFNIIFTGHSMGAGISVLATVEFLHHKYTPKPNSISNKRQFEGKINMVYNYTFSSPLIGDETFIEKYVSYTYLNKNNITRLVSKHFVFPNDPVTRIKFGNNNIAIRSSKWTGLTKRMFPNKVINGVKYVYAAMPKQLYVKMKETNKTSLHHGTSEILMHFFKNMKMVNSFRNSLLKPQYRPSNLIRTNKSISSGGGNMRSLNRFMLL